MNEDSKMAQAVGMNNPNMLETPPPGFEGYSRMIPPVQVGSSTAGAIPPLFAQQITHMLESAIDKKI